MVHVVRPCGREIVSLAPCTQPKGRPDRKLDWLLGDPAFG
jgi:hypothetical protein